MEQVYRLEILTVKRLAQASRGSQGISFVIGFQQSSLTSIQAALQKLLAPGAKIQIILGNMYYAIK